MDNAAMLANLSLTCWTIALCAIGAVAAGYVGFRVFWSN
jgi:hypothetical protein